MLFFEINSLAFMVILKPPRVLNFHRQLIRNEFPAIVADSPDQVVIIDEEDVAERVEGPAQLVVGAQLPALRIILRQAAQLEIGGKIQLQPGAEQFLGKVLIDEFFGFIFQHLRLASISFSGELQCKERRWF